MKKGSLVFNHIRLRADEIHKFRGYVGNVFKKYDLVHNHDYETGKPIYRYPLIQFKLLGEYPAIKSRGHDTNYKMGLLSPDSLLNFQIFLNY